MNKWKIAFFCCLIVLLITNCVWIYGIIDQSVTFAYQQTEYADTENDLNDLVDIVNQGERSKTSIREGLKKSNLFDVLDFESDTIPLYRISLIFENDTLKKVDKHF